MSAPANDDLANRTPLMIGQAVEITLTDATLEGTDETDIFTTDYDQSVWFEFTPDHDGVYGLHEFFFEGGGFGAHWWCSGTDYSDLTVLHGPIYGSAVSFDMTGGQTYLLRVAHDVFADPVNTVSLQIREYRWTDWIDQAEQTVPCARNVGWSGINQHADPIFAYSFPYDDDDNIVDIINEGLTEQHAALLGFHVGDDDSWFADQTVSPGVGASLGEPAGAAWAFRIKVGTDGDILDLHRVINVEGRQGMGQMTVMPNVSSTWNDDPTTRYEHDYATITSAALMMSVYAYNQSLRHRTENFGCEFKALLYLPGYDAYIPEQPHTETLIYGPAEVPFDHDDPLVDGFMLTLSGAQLAGMKAGGSGFSTVMFGVLLTAVTQPTVMAYAGNDEWDEGYSAVLDIDPEISSFTIQPPRVQLRELVPFGARLVTPPRRLHPRDDDLGPGIGRVWPPPTTQQSGRRGGPGAPV